MPSAILEKARNILRPSRDEMLRRAPSVHHFWNTNQKAFEQAWSDREEANGHEGIAPDRSLYSADLLQAVETAKPLKKGWRHNFVLWLYGEHGQIPYPHARLGEPVPAEKRLSVPAIPSDGSAPF